MDLDELSEGRFLLGLRTGVQRLNEDWHNARWGKPMAHLRETVGVVRQVVARVQDGEPVKLTPPTHGPAPEHVRAAQARVLELIADRA